MYTDLCDRLGIEFPIFAFSHCRDVVAAVSRAGGFGMLGAVGVTPEQLAIDLDWIDREVGDRPYGVDVVIPQNDSAGDEVDPVALHERLLKQVPQEHFDYAKKVLKDHGIPELAEGEFHNGMITRSNSTTARLHVAEAMRHPNVKVIANALGAPPQDLTDMIHDSGRLVAGLCGSVDHARRHAASGVDIIVAQGGEGGGHTGYIGSMVLWPQVVEAVAPLPVLAAGGVGNGAQIAAALAMGAQGVWNGTLWLSTEESEMTDVQRRAIISADSKDAIISRSLTGKRNRLLRSGWTEAWEKPEAPEPLPLPLQDLVAGEAVTRLETYPNANAEMHITPSGQVAGQIKKVSKAADLVLELAEQYLDATERLAALNARLEETTK
ncbi:nitronate monooxygenase [Rhodococcus erythropolis]|uniref:nitronate monooxygenase n=1 Tax=Rhodococcus erythropolis TaxID=1833 RepID=UPI001BEABF00|nr:nitronate monooxygenase family protein [Rhodococcus erythropolis]MBT2266077.1 nitronate monooxygenase [Rhodococcus erythropolis]